MDGLTDNPQNSVEVSGKTLARIIHEDGGDWLRAQIAATTAPGRPSARRLTPGLSPVSLSAPFNLSGTSHAETQRRGERGGDSRKPQPKPPRTPRLRVSPSLQSTTERAIELLLQRRTALISGQTKRVRQRGSDKEGQTKGSLLGHTTETWPRLAHCAPDERGPARRKGTGTLQ